MKLQQYLLNHYLHIPYEEFSYKASSALGILISIENNALNELSDDKKKKLKEDIEKVKEIIESTRKDIHVSMFVLDRNIAPQDFSRNPTNHVFTFPMRKVINDKDKIQLSQDNIQRLLCEATMEINNILMKQLAGFSEQMYFDEDEL